MHLSQLVNVSLTPPTVLMIPLGEDVPVGAAAEVAVAPGSFIPVGREDARPLRSVGTAVGTVTPDGTSVGRAGVCLGNNDTLMLAARPPRYLCSA